MCASAQRLLADMVQPVKQVPIVLVACLANATAQTTCIAFPALDACHASTIALPDRTALPLSALAASGATAITMALATAMQEAMVVAREQVRRRADAGARACLVLGALMIWSAASTAVLGSAAGARMPSAVSIAAPGASTIKITVTIAPWRDVVWTRPRFLVKDREDRERREMLRGGAAIR